MVSVAFVHDHCFIESDNQFYSTGKLTRKTWERYLSSFDCVNVIATSRVISPNESTDRLSRSSSENVKFSTVPKMGGISRLLERNTHRAFLRGVLGRTDAVVVRLPSYLGMLAIAEARKLRIPIGVEVVGCPFDSYRNHGSLLGKLMAPFAYVRMRSVMQSHPDVAMYVTNEFLQRRYPTKAPRVYEASNVELPDGVDWPEVMAARRTRWEARRQGSPIRVGFIGSLSTKYKGLEDLLRALAGVDFPFRLFVLGEGKSVSLLGLVEDLKLVDKVEFVEPLPGGAAVAGWLSSLDLYCQPSHTEGLPRALIEALAAGLVCSGSTAGGIPELIPAEFLFPAKSVQSIQEVLTRSSTMTEEELNKTAEINFHKARSFEPMRLAGVREQAWHDLAALASGRF